MTRKWRRTPASSSALDLLAGTGEQYDMVFNDAAPGTGGVLGTSPGRYSGADNGWTMVYPVSIGLGVGRVTKVGFPPFNFTAQFYGNAVYPNGGSSWTMRLQTALLFPKLSKEQENMLMEQKLKQLEQSLPKQ